MSSLKVAGEDSTSYCIVSDQGSMTMLISSRSTGILLIMKVKMMYAKLRILMIVLSSSSLFYLMRV